MCAQSWVSDFATEKRSNFAKLKIQNKLQSHHIFVALWYLGSFDAFEGIPFKLGWFGFIFGSQKWHFHQNLTKMANLGPSLANINDMLGVSNWNFHFKFIKGRPSSTKWVTNHVCWSKISLEKGCTKKITFRGTPCI